MKEIGIVTLLSVAVTAAAPGPQAYRPAVYATPKSIQDFASCFERSQDFPEVYEEEKPQQITDAAAIEQIVDQVLAQNPKQLEQYRAGKTTMLGFFVGQVMKLSKGQANPKLVNELLAKKLGS